MEQPYATRNGSKPTACWPNLSKDLGEKDNVAAANPEVVKQAAELLRKNHQPSEIFPLFPDELKAAGKKQRAGD